jgi:hypothetical protein
MWLDQTRHGTRAGASLLFDPQSPLRAVGDTGAGMAGERRRHLGHLLVAHGVLEERDDALVRLEAWVNTQLDAVACPDQRRFLRSYATLRVLRRARLRAAVAPRPRTPTAHSRNSLKAAIAFLGFMDNRGRVLADSTQTDIDTWLVECGPSAHEVGDFINWATDRRIIGRLVVTGPAHRQATPLDDDTRWAIVERLLHDESLDVRP